MTAIGIVGGIGAAFYYGPVLTVCVVLLALGVHRSKAIDGLRLGAALLCYVLLVAVSGFGLYKLGLAIEAHKAHPLTAEEFWKGHTTPSPPPQVINNNYLVTTTPDADYGVPEIYFGYPSSARGTVVTANSTAQKEVLFKKAAEGGYFNAKILPGYQNQVFQEIPIIVRNAGNGQIQNMSVEIASNTFIEGVTSGSRPGVGYSLTYDIPELPPYALGAQEVTVVVKIRIGATAFNPAAILVTVKGKGIKSSHSEIMDYAFQPLPS